MSNQDQQPPWGRRNRPQTPEELVAQLIKKVQDFFSEAKKPAPDNGDGGSTGSPANPFANIGKIFSFILVLIVLQGIYLSVFKIAPGEIGVVLRLGQYMRSAAPGLHFKIPYVDTLYKVDTESIRKEEFGFRTRLPGQAAVERTGYEAESLMLTADKNVINVAWIVQYKVSDPYSFLFQVRNVQQAIRDASESVTRRIVGNMDFDYVLSYRELLAADVKMEMQALLDKLEAGVGVVTVQFQDINPPDPVKPAFNEVNEADQDMKRLVNEAQETYNRVIPKASGDAKKIIQEAHGYAAARINDAKGETERFTDILREYKNSPDVTRKRLYLEAMQEILPNVESVYVIDEDQQSPLPLLNISGAKGLPVPDAK